MNFNRNKCVHEWLSAAGDLKLMHHRICRVCGNWQWLLPPAVVGGTQSKWEWIPDSVLDAESSPVKTEFDLWSENFPTT